MPKSVASRSATGIVAIGLAHAALIAITLVAEALVALVALVTGTVALVILICHDFHLCGGQSTIGTPLKVQRVCREQTGAY